MNEATLQIAFKEWWEASYGLELRARVETLERRCEVLQERHHRLTLQVGHLEYELVRDEDDLPQQHCLEAMDPPESDQHTSQEDFDG
jgi:hypothetical protein